jgi:hypothetical protein
MVAIAVRKLGHEFRKTSIVDFTIIRKHLIEWRSTQPSTEFEASQWKEDGKGLPFYRNDGFSCLFSKVTH